MKTITIETDCNQSITIVTDNNGNINSKICQIKKDSVWLNSYRNIYTYR